MKKTHKSTQKYTFPDFPSPFGRVRAPFGLVRAPRVMPVLDTGIHETTGEAERVERVLGDLTILPWIRGSRPRMTKKGGPCGTRWETAQGEMGKRFVTVPIYKNFIGIYRDLSGFMGIWKKNRARLCG